MGFKELRSCLEELKRRDLLFTIDRLIDKDSELMPLVRWQYRGLEESARRGFLFTNVTYGRGRSYDASVAVAVLGASRQVYATALGCNVDALRDRWIRAAANPITPVVVKGSEAPVKQEIHGPDEVGREGLGMDEFPVPISTPGYDPAPFVTSGHWVTKDLETGIRNVGNYRGHVKAPNRLGLQLFPTQHEGIHWKKRRERGQDLEAAIVVGAPPTVAMTAVAKLPYGVDEFAVAGALSGEPIELVRCETVDLEVPATAEIVIEGRITTRYLEPEAPFGEFTGFVGERTLHPCLELSCVTHRRRPICQSFISQFPPSESTMIRAIANEAGYYNLLKNHCNVPTVMDVVFHESAGALFLMVIRLKKTSPAQPSQALLAAAALDPTYGKILIAVDDDIDPYDLNAVLWACATRMQPHLDVTIIQNRASMLDPSAAHPEAPREQQWYPKPRGAGALLIDATRKWDYPPVSLPKEEFMRRARQIWEDERLPSLSPKHPWYGYPLGPWPAEWEEEADIAVKGRYYETGEKLARQRVSH
jgi:4-hydroxy-3-polyprenylbenzoate decarboxylase